MARARNIKPGFFKNEILGVADPLYSLLFEGLWVLADRSGRLEDRPLRIKAEIFPYRDSLDMDAMLEWLEENGFIQRYTSQGKKCILVLEFVKHQNPHKNETESELPAPDGFSTNTEIIDTSSEKIGSTRADSLSSDSLTTDSLIPERESASRKPPAKRATPAPDIPRPDDVAEQTWADWCKLRKAKRAPVTQTVIDGARGESVKAGMALEDFLQVWCRRGSQGLEAAWLKPDERRPTSGSRQSDAEPAWRREQRERTQAAAPGVAAKPTTFDMEAAHGTTPALG